MSGTFFRASAKLEHSSALRSACRKFNGSKIDRAFSFSKLDATLNANAQRQESSESQITPVMETGVRKVRDSSTSARTSIPTFAPSFERPLSPELAHHSAPSHGHIHDHSSGGGAGLLSLLAPEPGAGGDDNAPMPKPKKKKKKGRSVS